MAYLIGTTKLYCGSCGKVRTFKVWTVSEKLTRVTCTEVRTDLVGSICRWEPTSALVHAAAIARAKSSEIDTGALQKEEAVAAMSSPLARSSNR